MPPTPSGNADDSLVVTEQVEFPDSSGPETMELTPLGDDLYLMEWSPVCSEFAGWHDVVRCHRATEGHLVCTELVRPSGLHRYYTISWPGFLESRNWEELQRRIMASDGNWELIWGGIIVLHYPEEKIAEFEALLRVVEPE